MSDTLLADLESTGRDPLEAFSPDEVGEKPKLAMPSIVALIQDVRSSIRLNEADRDAMLTAMRLATEKRVEGILGNSRRRHYGHAAMLAASCLALAPRGSEKNLSTWITGLRQTYSRRHAFRDELTPRWRSWECLRLNDGYLSADSPSGVSLVCGAGPHQIARAGLVNTAGRAVPTGHTPRRSPHRGQESAQRQRAGFTFCFRSVPKSVPIESSRSACAELQNLLRFRTLASRRRFCRPASSRIRLHHKNSQDPQVLAYRILTDVR